VVPANGYESGLEQHLEKQRVNLKWLTDYLHPPELEVVARASIYAGPFTLEAVAAVGCNNQELGQTLKLLVRMSVLREEGDSYMGGARFSMHPLIRGLGGQLRTGQLRKACGWGRDSVEAMMLRWVLLEEEGPGSQFVRHHPFGSEPDNSVCRAVAAAEAANFREAVRLLGASSGVGFESGEFACSMRSEVSAISEAMLKTGFIAQALELDEMLAFATCKWLGDEDPYTLATMAELAVARREMGDMKGAVELHNQVVEVSEKLWGDHGASTLVAKSSMADTLSTAGHLEESRKLHEQVLQMQIQSEMLGPDHEATLITMHNLAGLLTQLGLHEDAVKLQERHLERTTTLGADVDTVLTSTLNLANGLRMRNGPGDLARSRAMLEHVEAEWTRLLGAENPSTLNATFNLANALQAQGLHREACKKLNELLQVQKRVLRPGHISILHTVNSLASSLLALEDFQGARELSEKAVPGCIRGVGREHVLTAAAMRNLAAALYNLEDLPNALDRVFMQSKEIGAKLRGSEDQNVICANVGAAFALRDMGETEEARDRLQECADNAERGLGADHD
jgi:tetratricopeptide (TPR) repeat protein